jgi:hypothetical protein
LGAVLGVVVAQMHRGVERVAGDAPQPMSHMAQFATMLLVLVIIVVAGVT